MGNARSQLGSWLSVDRVFGLTLAIISLVCMADLRNTPNLEFWGQDGPGPSWLPFTLSLILLVLSLPLIFSRTHTTADQLGASIPGTIKFIVLVLALAWVFPILGGQLALGLFVVVEMLWVEKQRLLTSVVAAVVSMVVVWAVFVQLLGIPLPVGPLGI